MKLNKLNGTLIGAIIYPAIFFVMIIVLFIILPLTAKADSLYVDHYKIDQLQASGWVIPARTEMHILDLQKAIEKLTTEGWVIPNELLESFRHQLNYVNAGKPPQ